MRQNKTQNSQAGNVFIIILAGVVLFGALMFTFSKGGQKGSGNLTKQQAKIAAQEILNYARLVEGAVDRVRHNGCSENEINFNNAVVSGYSNTNAPIDGSCDIFGEEGGKVSYIAPDTATIDSNFQSAFTGNIYYYWGEFVFSGNNNFQGIGPAQPCGASSTCKELGLAMHFLKQNVCFAINNLLNIPLTSGDAPPERISSPPGSLSTTKFVGNFKVGTEGVDDGVDNAYSACLKTAPGGGNSTYSFYHVLLAR